MFPCLKTKIHAQHKRELLREYPNRMDEWSSNGCLMVVKPTIIELYSVLDFYPMFDRCDTMELAKKYGTPLYVIYAKGMG